MASGFGLRHQRAAYLLPRQDAEPRDNQEGTNMNIVESIPAINTQQQPYPHYTSQSTVNTENGKNSPGSSFLECLNFQIQQVNASAVMTNQEEYQSIGILMGLYPPLWVSPKPR